MARVSWSEAVETAVRRYVLRTGTSIFTRQELNASELAAIIVATGSTGATPHKTLDRELQQLRDAGRLAFLGGGTYHWLGDQGDVAQTGTSKGVLVMSPPLAENVEPERLYRFPSRHLASASRMIGEWVVYQRTSEAGDRGYYAMMQVERIIPDPTDNRMHLALARPGSFLEFGRDVPVDAQHLGSRARSGGYADRPVRAISAADFNEIIRLGLAEDDFLPRTDDDDSPSLVREESQPWSGPVERSTLLVSRKVRNRQFRRRVLDVYSARCALTGVRLINGGGRAEAEAAHIMSVEAGGPDVVSNGIALSRTVHWMFDRGLISLGDDGDILLSRKINETGSVERLIYHDRKARLPRSPLHRPHVQYLRWHRDECFHA